ncbi:GntR family transcriptional regulator [Petroclostridium xylanilyticum]|jgi:DNA-binding GntR family transcriptional regulator|uniref:GntR family transcriptional regulator n=1 Tax=Petroclostridium xylanilyticum TaxID=1792311 RepID=UPI000B998CCF|nr:GntR family transcriptional regulator [Petroclostridium xylanilyticum]
MDKHTSKATLIDTIYHNIKRDIAQRILEPGEKINIKKLSERYGASETPIKQALNRLISENLIENIPRKGMKVKTLQPDEIDEIFDMRLMLDLFYTKEIITTVNNNDSLREQLEKNVKEHLEIVSKPMPIDAYIINYEYDKIFHELYLKSSGSKKIVEIFHNLNPYMYTNYFFRKQSPDRDVAGVKEHEAILNAILSQDEQALKEAVTTHILNSKRTVGLILKVDRML